VVYLTRKPNYGFEIELAEWARLLATRNGYAFFGPGLPDTSTAADLARHVSLRLLAESGHEFLYKVIPRQ
jgi:hypothetical protein